MMTNEQLQELSQRAAGCLPEAFDLSRGGIDLESDRPSGWVYYHDDRDAEWLHESTETCAEIMVRVLWPASIDITGDGESQAAYCLPTDIEANGVAFKEDAPMLAFRVAVLHALIALSEPTKE